ncbi:MAG: helix-turn-helix domain-containing protein [Acidimicrobiales bacterium]
MKQNVTVNRSRDRRFTGVVGLAAYLDISERHVRRLVLQRRVPHHKLGSLLRFDLDEIDRWMLDSEPAEERTRAAGRVLLQHDGCGVLRWLCTWARAERR